MKPKALVITAAGINCDVELGRAFALAGADVQSLHLNELLAEPMLIDQFDLIGLPGGFSYGDAVAAGRVMASIMRQKLYRPLVRAIERGVPIIAPCNGFQIAVQIGLLPGPPEVNSEVGTELSRWPDEPAAPTVALAHNASNRFVDRWTRITVPSDTRCIWTQGMQMDEHTAVLPIAHGEGRVVVADDDVLAQLRDNGQIAVRYATDDNPNGSVDDIAGICDSTGLVFGLMPHPERYTRWTQHPWWTRMDRDDLPEHTPGLQMFRNAVAHVMQREAIAG